MVAEITFHHQREDFPPHPDDPSSRKIESIVSFLTDNIKRAVAVLCFRGASANRASASNSNVVK